MSPGVLLGVVSLGIMSSAMLGRIPSPVVPGVVTVGMGLVVGAVVAAVLGVVPAVVLGMVVSLLRLRQPARRQVLRTKTMAITMNLLI